MLKLSSEVLYRPAEDSDGPFILKSWVRCALESKQYAGLSRQRTVDALRGTIADLVERGANITVAANPSNPSQIMGFVCYERCCDFPVVHFVYVKELYRGLRIASSLLAIARGNKPGKLHYTFKGRAVRGLAPEGKWQPFLIREHRHK